jgi:endo-1,4-beta-xylanase
MELKSGSRREFVKHAAAAAAAGGLAALMPAAWGSARVGLGGWGQTAAQDVTGSNSLRAHAAARGMLVGCAVVPEKLERDASYASLVAAQANILVPENAMKWGALRPSPDKFDFRGADASLAFAQAHDQKVRGHNLCWHEALPSWFAGTVTKDNAAQLLTQHIQTVAGRYAGKLQAWDVVNEAIDPKNGRPDALRKSPWLEMIGPDYLDLAFKTARQADGTALLTYNDYGIELDSPDQTVKRDAVMTLVKGMKKRGVPIDAVGVQSHLDATSGMPGEGLRKSVRELHKMGLQVFVTEMDVNDRKVAGTVAERDAAVAQVYREYLTMMLAEPNVNVALTWGITDRSTWLNGPKYARADGLPERPLPFDADCHPAPAFFAERDAMDSRRARG